MTSEDLQRLFPGDSELARRMRDLDWTQTALGPPETWPENLRIALRICLTSRFPMHVWWGRDLTLLYNDAYISFLGPVKHPAVLGRSGREAWSEIWPTIGPMIDSVFSTGVASWSEDILMFFDRVLPKEEVYVTFSFSPILGEGNEVEGLFCACTEVTEKLIGNRRLETLRRLGIRAAQAQTVDEACETSADVLAKNPHDIPFSAIYALDSGGPQASLRACSGLPPKHPLPLSISISGADLGPLPLSAALRSRRAKEVTDLTRLGVELPGGPWPERAQRMLILPIPGATRDAVAGLLVAGVSPRRVLDVNYRFFFNLVAGHVGTAIAEAQAHEAERKRAERLAELDRAKTAFFANVSHEFRTPLTLMLGPLSDVLRSQDLSGEERASLAIVHRNGLRLLKLVNTLLDFSRIEAGRAQAAFEPTDLAALTLELAGVFRAAIERAGLRFTVRCERLNEPVYVDRDMWEKIVLNLLSNALKHTFEGEIEVVLRRAGARVELWVTDTGTGVAPENLPRVFERFQRVEGVRARTHEGAGIGLSLVRELVRLHRGDIWATSEVGKGTRFVVSLLLGSAHLPDDRVGAPVTFASSTATGQAAFKEEAERWLPEPERDSVAPPSSGGDDLSGVRILIADDNADMRAYMKRLLERRFSVKAVENGEAALEALQSQHFDLVISDVMMPGLDGMSLVRKLRADPKFAALPVIVLSARAEEEARVEGLQAGADDYLIKPFSARELLARVEAHINLAFRRQAMEANRAKDDFIAMLGHELRNPLAPIKTAIEYMRLNGAQGQELDIIERQANRLARLVDDLLDVSRITHGKIELRKRRIELSEALAQAIETASPLLERRHIQLHTNVRRSGLAIDADPDRMAQIFSNLVTNAAKYSPPGSRIFIDATRLGGRLRVRVIDEGIGIAPDMIGKVFDRFVQQSQSLARSKGGLGLGLTIVKSLVELHGGKVTVHSDGPGKGSEFCVELPAAELSNVEPEEASSPHSSRLEAPQGGRILIVDDNDDAATTLENALEKLGYTVQVANDGPQALQAARAFRPAVALLDLGLPVMDGYELARRLRELTGPRERLRLVAVTGYGQDADRRRSAEAGFEDHLIKPVDLTHLARVVRRLSEPLRVAHGS